LPSNNYPLTASLIDKLVGLASPTTYFVGTRLACGNLSASVFRCALPKLCRFNSL
jgi:hypothetical protein